jgi:hypothetical protein
MSKNDADVRLPDRAEELLRGWPAPERDDEAWEQNAKAVMSRLGEAKAELSLLEAPLPQGEEDRKSDPGAPKRSLLELARSVEADDKQSAAADLARESFALANRERTSSPSFHDNVRPSQPVSATATPMPALPPNVTRLEKRSNAGPVGMVIVALAGLAAATFIVMQTRKDEQPTAAIVPPTIVVTNAPAPAATAKTEESEVVALGDLDTAKGAPKKGLNQGGATAMAEKPKPGEASPVAKPTTKTPDPEEDVKLRPAESTGGTPEKPALGAVQAAVGAVLGSARACVAGQDDASSATITFGSDGRVQSVAVSGPAQGTNAEPCIKAALSKARVQPFSRPTFAASTAVRP